MERRLTAGSRFALHAAKAQVAGMQKDSLRSPLARPGAALRDMPLRGTSGAVCSWANMGISLVDFSVAALDVMGVEA